MKRRPSYVEFWGSCMKESPGRGRHGRHQRVTRDERASLGELDPFVHVDARILPADDVLRGREIQPEPEADQNERCQRGETWSRRIGFQPQPAAGEQRDGDAHNEVRCEQSVEGVLFRRRQAQGDR